MSAYQDEIIKHYEAVLKTAANIYLFDKGPYEKLPNSFRILEFPPDKERNMWTYATCCMSQPEDATKIELHIFSSIQDHTLLEILASIAYYHRRSSTLGLHHTVNFGRSWQHTSKCDHGFISLPYIDGADMENLGTARFYWLIPVTQEEVNLKIQYGVEALEERMEANSGFNYLDPLRKSLV